VRLLKSPSLLPGFWAPKELQTESVDAIRAQALSMPQTSILERGNFETVEVWNLERVYRNTMNHPNFRNQDNFLNTDTSDES
jgi:hypothetical protein